MVSNPFKQTVCLLSSMVHTDALNCLSKICQPNRLSIAITNINETARLINELVAVQNAILFSADIYSFLIAFFVCLIIFVFMVRLALRLNRMKSESKYINMEIRRTKGSERRYWKRKKRRLWLYLFPFCKR